MNIKQLKEFLPYAHKINVSVMVHGLHGIGKSQSISQYAKENGMEFIDRRLSQIEAGELLGLPDISGEVTKYKIPSWLPRDPKSKGILFLDELNRARRDVLQGVFQLVLDRELGDYRLPDGWQVVTAVNPNTDDYDVTNVFDAALMDRFLHVKLTPTTEEFINYMRSKKTVSGSFVDFLQLREELIEDSKLNSFALERKPSRRSNLKAGELVALNLPEDLIVEGVGGLIGIANAVAFMAYLKENEVRPLSAEEIYDMKDETLATLKKYLDKTTGRSDVINATLDNIMASFSVPDSSISDNQLVNVMALLEMSPKDLSRSFITRALNSKESVVQKIAIRMLEKSETNWILAKDAE